jgi:NodT family efflux transporter outer membrane factor (OMF) lipoprotein
MIRKFEIRSTKSETNSKNLNPKFETGPNPARAFGALDFGFVSNFDIRISSFCLSGSLGLLFLSGMFLLAGCKVGPNFQPPQTQVPNEWVGPVPPPPTAAEQDLAQWWTVFEDPTLTSLVERAIQSNLDLKLAEARVRQARAARGVAASGLGPTVDATGSYRRSGNAVTTADLYQTGLDAAWELDIFGGTRRSIEAATANLEAAADARLNTLVTLTAELALNYIDLRGFQERIAIAQRNLKAQQHSAELTRQRFQGGLVSGLDVANAEAQVASTAAQIPSLEQSAQQAIYSLSLLLGREPGALLEELSPLGDIPAGPPAVPVGVPSELLRRRPDIRQAEAQIHAVTAQIGVATADLFPRFSLTGNLGTQGSQFSALGDWANRFWSVGPSASWTLFATGRIRSNIEVQKALQEQSLIAYRQTVLTALQDVENALIASVKEQEHYQALTAAVTANRRAVDLATKLYTQGQTDFLNVLQAQGALYLSETALALSAGTVSTNLVALYKALGGGWTPDPPAEPPTKK